MAELKELREERIKKLNNLESLGINCYPASITLQGEKVLSEVAHARVSKGENLTEVVLSGRVMTVRGQGKIFVCGYF
jgi:lysyl-tRNA synthetase class II